MNLQSTFKNIFSNHGGSINIVILSALCGGQNKVIMEYLILSSSVSSKTRILSMEGTREEIN